MYTKKGNGGDEEQSDDDDDEDRDDDDESNLMTLSEDDDPYDVERGTTMEHPSQTSPPYAAFKQVVTYGKDPQPRSISQFVTQEEHFLL